MFIFPLIPCDIHQILNHTSAQIWLLRWEYVWIEPGASANIPFPLRKSRRFTPYHLTPSLLRLHNCQAKMYCCFSPSVSVCVCVYAVCLCDHAIVIWQRHPLGVAQGDVILGRRAHFCPLGRRTNFFVQHSCTNSHNHKRPHPTRRNKPRRDVSEDDCQCLKRDC